MTILSSELLGMALIKGGCERAFCVLYKECERDSFLSVVLLGVSVDEEELRMTGAR